MTIAIPEQVFERYAAGESAEALGREFGMRGQVIVRRARDRGMTLRPGGFRAIGLPHEAIDLYLDGMSIADVARRFDTPRGRVRRMLLGAGIRLRDDGATYRYIPTEFFWRYVTGETGQNLARELGISPVTFYARLRARGMAVRAVNEYTPQLSPLIGKPRSQASMELAAKTREANCSNTSTVEDKLALILDQLGIRYVRQKAIGRYNVDFALIERNLVLEVTNAWHMTGKHNTTGTTKRANDAKRRAFIESCGWSYTEIAEPFDHLLHFATPDGSLFARPPVSHRKPAPRRERIADVRGG